MVFPGGGEALDGKAGRAERLGERQPDAVMVLSVQADCAARRDGDAVPRSGMRVGVRVVGGQFGP